MNRKGGAGRKGKTGMPTEGLFSTGGGANGGKVSTLNGAPGVDAEEGPAFDEVAVAYDGGVGAGTGVVTTALGDDGGGGEGGA